MLIAAYALSYVQLSLFFESSYLKPAFVMWLTCTCQSVTSKLLQDV